MAVAIVTKFLSPTNTKGSRIKVECKGRTSKTYPYDYSARCANDTAAKQYLKDVFGWTVGEIGSVPCAILPGDGDKKVYILG